MTKLLVIGIDGMDAGQVSKYEEALPNFRNLAESTPKIKMESVFPPDSIPAWGSIYTGLNPAEHGVVNFVDPLDEKLKIRFQEIHKQYIGKTFWDEASRNGKKVCILVPYSIYPPWELNGVMVCRSLDIVDKNYPLKTYPEKIYEEFKLHEININLFHGFPSKRNLRTFMESCRERSLQECDLATRFLRNYDADLYFVYFSALDAIQHTFWNYCDPTHPDYPGENEYENTIKEFYILFDEILGKLLSETGEDFTIIAISDHGHGMRPVNLVNLNELLRTKGYLTSNITENRTVSPLQKKEKIKHLLIQAVNFAGVGSLGLKVINKLPFIKKFLSTPNYIDWTGTVAYLSAISGVKSYSEGGILINKSKFDFDYENLVTRIIRDLSEIPHPETGENLMKWICRREDLYRGDYLFKYPDIVFELADNYGVGWDIHCPLIGKSSMSSFQPGSHVRSSAVFFRKGVQNNQDLPDPISVMDVKKIILNSF